MYFTYGLTEHAYAWFWCHLNTSAPVHNFNWFPEAVQGLHFRRVNWQKERGGLSSIGWPYIWWVKTFRLYALCGPTCITFSTFHGHNAENTGWKICRFTVWPFGSSLQPQMAMISLHRWAGRYKPLLNEHVFLLVLSWANSSRKE